MTERHRTGRSHVRHMKILLYAVVNDRKSRNRHGHHFVKAVNSRIVEGVPSKLSSAVDRAGSAGRDRNDERVIAHNEVEKPRAIFLSPLLP